MSRKREESVLDVIFDLLKLTPIWFGPLLSLLAFAFIRWFLPSLFSPKPQGFDAGVMLRPLFPTLSWIAGGAILMAWIGAEAHKLQNRRLFDRQKGIDSVRSLSWSEFEHLIGEYYRRQGYLVEVVGRSGGDGGVDIVLSEHGQRVLVQCKQWKAWKVGVQAVRELLGVVTSQRASRGILVTSGSFTGEARRFAETNQALELVDGNRLEGMIRSVQAGTLPQSKTSQVPSRQNASSATPACPSCGSTMVLRTAHRGSNAGSQFWGCPSYPKCRGTRAYS